MPLDGRRRHAEHAGGLIDGEAAEKSQFNNSALLGIELGEFGEGIIERNQIEIPAVELHRLVESEGIAGISFVGAATSRIFNENLAHQLGADGDEVFAIAELRRTLLLQTEISLVHQGGALQSVAVALLPHVMVRQAT